MTFVALGELRIVRLLTWLFVSASIASATDWPQFRGAGGNGVATTADKFPPEIGPEHHVRWKVALPPGHSSPVIVGSKIFLSAVRDKNHSSVRLCLTHGVRLFTHANTSGIA